MSNVIYDCCLLCVLYFLCLYIIIIVILLSLEYDRQDHLHACRDGGQSDKLAPPDVPQRGVVGHEEEAAVDLPHNEQGLKHHSMQATPKPCEFIGLWIIMLKNIANSYDFRAW